ncbi:MAG: Hsp33 family molecular chaperone HslO [Pseudomonadales bacterium]|nr:Hsp33 family molecular chaperone HslO [Pseudomonadales bacterium]
MLSDSLQKFLFDETDIRGAIVTLNKSFADLIDDQGYSSAQLQLIAEFSAANILMTGNLKFEGSLILQARGTGPVSLVTTECDEQLNFRGLIDASHDLVDIPFTDVFTDATLAITVEPKQGHRYQGIVSLAENDLAACLQAYFQQSEQLPTWFRFSESDGVVRGIMLQALPAQLCMDKDKREEDWTRICHFASTLSAQEMASLDNETLLHRLYHEEVVRIFDPQACRFHCSCSKERLERALLSMGEPQLREILAEDGEIKTNCHFCQTEYLFNEDDIRQLIQGKSSH